MYPFKSKKQHFLRNVPEPIFSFGLNFFFVSLNCLLLPRYTKFDAYCFVKLDVQGAVKRTWPRAWPQENMDRAKGTILLPLCFWCNLENPKMPPTHSTEVFQCCKEKKPCSLQNRIILRHNIPVCLPRLL